MVSYREFAKENEKYLVIAGKYLKDPSIFELREIIESHRDFSKIYVLTNYVSTKVAGYLKDSGAIVIDSLPFNEEERVIKRFAREYGLKEINSL
jgi:hypothetical protein